MLTSFAVKNFRNLESVTLDRLGRLTLIGGKNGAGKTALLEALWLFSGSDFPELSERVNSFTGLPPLGPEHMFRNIFPEFDTRNTIEMIARGDWGDMPRQLRIHIRDRLGNGAVRSNLTENFRFGSTTFSQSEGESEIVFDYRHDNGEDYTSRAWWVAETLVPARSMPGFASMGIAQDRQAVPNRASSVFMASLQREDLQTTASKFGKLQLRGEVEKILQFIRPLEPRLDGLLLITVESTPIIYASLEGMPRPIPVQLLGEGLNRMLGLVLSMNEASGGLLLVDEIENGLHYSVQEEVFSALLDLAEEFDVQVFATTHSAECTRAAHAALAKEDSREFSFYRLDRVNGAVKAVDFDHERMGTAIEYNMEVR